MAIAALLDFVQPIRGAAVMTKTVVGSFDTFEHASSVVDALAAQGVSRSDVSLVANDAAGRLAAGRDTDGSIGASRDPVTGARTRDVPSESDRAGDSVASGAGTGAVAGGVIGGTAGLIAGLAGLAVPGIGPLVAAGPIAAALTGAGIGAIAGGLIGGLRQVGVSDADAEYYAEAVRRGGALVIVRADDAHAEQISQTMRLHGAIDIESRAAAWREAGWTGFNEQAQPYTHAEIEEERVLYRGTATGTVRETRSDSGDPRSGSMAGTPVTGAGVGGTTRASDHPNLGAGSDRPGVDVRGRDPVRSDRPAGTAPGGDDGSIRGAVKRAGDAGERRIPGDSDGDGR